MKQSIENIWKDGFKDNHNLSVPELHDLYNKESQNLVDKMERMFDLNLKFIVGGGLMFLLVSVLLSFPLFGVWVAVLLGGLVYAGKLEQQNLAQIDRNVSAYDYLKSFDGWMKKNIARYTRLYTWFYPLIFIGGAIQLRITDAMGEILVFWLEKAPDTAMLAGTPVILWVAALVMIILLTVFAGSIYRWDLNIVYGRALKKLEKLIADMEELRK